MMGCESDDGLFTMMGCERISAEILPRKTRVDVAEEVEQGI